MIKTILQKLARPAVAAAVVLCLNPSLSKADDELLVPRSPKEGWGDISQASLVQKEPTSFSRRLLLWIPNRVIDFLDIFRADAGVGIAAGGVIRMTSSGQMGYRAIRPFSLRVGWFGRRLPIQLETEDEIGAGVTFTQSPARQVCASEFGVGVDLIGGLYGGICLEEAVDFITGIFFIDLLDDDL